MHGFVAASADVERSDSPAANKASLVLFMVIFCDK